APRRLEAPAATARPARAGCAREALDVARAQREDVRDERLRLRQYAVLPDRRRALVPAGERAMLVAVELPQQLAQVEDADADVPRCRARHLRPAEQDGLDVAPRRRQDLHHA